ARDAADDFASCNETVLATRPRDKSHVERRVIAPPALAVLKSRYGCILPVRQRSAEVAPTGGAPFADVAAGRNSHLDCWRRRERRRARSPPGVQYLSDFFPQSAAMAALFSWAS